MNTMKKCNFCALKDAKPCMECSMCMSGDNHFRPIPKVEKSDSLKRGDDMTFEELKKEAKRQGYNLIKIKPREKFLPCTCGAKCHQWRNYVDGRSVICKRCGKESPIVPNNSTDNEVIAAWNRMIEEERR